MFKLLHSKFLVALLGAQKTMKRLILFLVTGAIVTALMTPLASTLFQSTVYQEGEIARTSVRAPRDFFVQDKERKRGERRYHHVKQGEVIVRAGDRVSAATQAKLENLAKLESTEARVRSGLSYGLLSFCVLVAVFGFTLKSWRNFKPTDRDIILLLSAVSGVFLTLEIYLILGRALSLSFPNMSPSILLLAAPVAAGGIILQVTLSTPAVFFFVTSAGLLTGLFLRDIPEAFLLVVLGNLIGVLSVKNWARRSAFLRAGVRVAVVNVAVVFCFMLVEPAQVFSDGLYRVVFALLGGLTSGVFGAMLTPFAEYIGSYLTDIKLLELSSLDQPLLRELSLQAPGTWNHSMVLGQLGEAAAEAVGANSLLTRVGAYYHDIGKVKKPMYFIENQLDRGNRHDRLSPSMSALIIRAHVKDGMEQAEKHRLPQAIIDLIPQHHGTALIEYFYEKAVREAEPGEKVDDSLFRYPGPKPQSKEAGIIMLGDAAEAATRSISEPTPAKIQGAVQKVINRVFTSGQLEQCDLTLRDLHLIAKAFSRVLSGIYHRRIEYAEPADKRFNGRVELELINGRAGNNAEQGIYDGRNSRETAGGEFSKEASRDKVVSTGRRDALRRLGM